MICWTRAAMLGVEPFDEQRAVVDLLYDQGLQLGTGIQLEQLLENQTRTSKVHICCRFSFSKTTRVVNSSVFAS